MIFPHFENINLINEIREKYDPLANLVLPHITLVFPFDSPISNEALSKFMDNKLEGIPPFKICLQGIKKQEDPNGNYLFLMVYEGQEEIKQIHKLLYSDMLKQYDIGLAYKPHMTIGKLNTIQEMNAAYEDVNRLTEAFITDVDTISVEMIGENDKSIIIIEKKLC